MSMPPFNHTHIPLIIEKLKPLHPHKIILFGSHAYGTPHVDSDIDLIVVLNMAGIYKTYAEKVIKRRLVQQPLLEIERNVPLDTLVYTKDEWDLFLSHNSSFSREIQQTGIVLYETHHPRMAQPS